MAAGAQCGAGRSAKTGVDAAKHILAIHDEHMTLDTIKIILEDMGHVVSTFSDSTAGIAEAVSQEHDHIPSPDLPNAGEPPVEPIEDAVLVCNTELSQKKAPAAGEGEKVDSRALSPWPAGCPQRSGEMGMEVTGRAVAFGRSAVPSPRPGINTEIQGDSVIAACDGRFVPSKDSFGVNEVLDVPGQHRLRGTAQAGMDPGPQRGAGDEAQGRTGEDEGRRHR
jgi:hypothetical protein